MPCVLLSSRSHSRPQFRALSKCERTSSVGERTRFLAVGFFSCSLDAFHNLGGLVSERDTIPAAGSVVGISEAVDFRLRPERLALLLVDMQYASACRTTGLGRWLSNEGRSEEGVYRFDRLENLVVPNLRRLLVFFREQELSVVHVRLGAQVPSCSDLIPTLRRIEHLIGNYVGSREFEILDELAPLPSEPVVTKQSASAFNSSGLDAVLRNLGMSQLVVGGVSTSHCVDMTARDASDRGYEVLVVEDACAEDEPELHESSLTVFRRLFGRVDSTSAVLRELAPEPLDTFSGPNPA